MQRPVAHQGLDALVLGTQRLTTQADNWFKTFLVSRDVAIPGICLIKAVTATMRQKFG